MPYKTSSEATRRDSQAVVERLGVGTIDVPITDQIDAYFARFPQRLATAAGQQVRPRADDRALRPERRVRRLVVGTSNKSELLLGYGTQFGDMASAINPIGDLYKTQLYQLAAHLGVPEQILANSRPATCGSGRPTRASWAFSYAEVDRLLVLMVDRRWHRAELLRAGFAAEFVDRVATMIRRNHYKRRMPVDRQALAPHDGSRLPLRPRLGNVKGILPPLLGEGPDHLLPSPFGRGAGGEGKQ